ncbi:WD repeat-containing protein 44-like [Dorcoceras hygrometricum]|uniref:WD repeat-containing protein 44-like n=1 Tax=Dorcoceras hygrometricum TaxID=472368 RepID=A0A2Z7D1Z4_9LAMI|nr:WD repeat-containing protein 44-like [Dorcoceras hygrometricum]
MMDRRTLTMNWDGLGDDDDDDRFFESSDRISSAVTLDLASSGSDDDDFEDSRMSFVSAVSSASIKSIRSIVSIRNPSSLIDGYGLWTAEPGDINERRKRLLQGMGLSSNKEVRKIASSKVVQTISTRDDAGNANVSTTKVESCSTEELKPDEPSHAMPVVLVRSRSDGDIEAFSAKTKQRKEDIIGPESKQRLTRTSSGQLGLRLGVCQYSSAVRISPRRSKGRTSMPPSEVMQSVLSDGAFGSFFLIKNLDTGKEFIVKEYNEEGMWNKLSDVQTGKQLTMEEFERSVGYSPVVKELMRRENGSRSIHENGNKIAQNSYLSKSFRNSKRRGAAILKNIKLGVTHSMSGLIVDKEQEHSASAVDQKDPKNASSQWVKTRQHGKPYKEFTALHMSQVIQAHTGSIWTIRFSCQARFLASAGEDRMIHVWEVQECDVMSARLGDDSCSFGGTPVHPMAGPISERPPLAEITPSPSERRKKGKINKKKGHKIPDYVNMPETVFVLSEKPVCSFQGHQDDVLDLSWSKSQLLLSSSMDKTVRMWDLESKSCLKMFAHNDYVTCIQFNPVNDDYFISGSLDAKVRIWSIPDRQVVDWTDLNEMVTAACYTPDGQGAVIGSHKGSFRTYSIDADYKLEQKDQIEIKKKKKVQAKKITGFQFSPSNSSEVLVTSADSRIRILNGLELVQKLRGFRNTSSQISASFSPDGKHIISASEDSQVYIWKLDESKNPGGGKGRTGVTIFAHEHFNCKDVSVAIPWPGSVRNEPPMVEIHSKRHSKRSNATPPQSLGNSPTKEDNRVAGASSRRHLPPLPKKNNTLERLTSCAEDEFANSSRMDDPGIGVSESFGSSSQSLRYDDPSSISASGSSPSQSWSSSWNLFDGGSSQTVQATAWGMVIVTASLGGELRVYQNFGLPLKVSRQANLFRDH